MLLAIPPGRELINDHYLGNVQRLRDHLRHTYDSRTAVDFAFAGWVSTLKTKNTTGLSGYAKGLLGGGGGGAQNLIQIRI